VKIERQDTGRDYIALLTQADPARHTTKKRRRVIHWANQYFEWDIFVEPHSGLKLLEAEVDNLNSPIKLPSFLQVELEVTSDEQHANYTRALG
jgi:CYTH domain-containing protein